MNSNEPAASADPGAGPVVPHGHDGRATLSPVGELDDAGELRDSIRKASCDFGIPLRIDLSAVTYMPSMAIGVLFGAIAAAHDAGTEIEVAVQADSVVHRVAVVTALPHVVV